jgi:predicted short-subunit dehydrogenase-like oxidoreductase (DUF2520 family)
VVGAGRLGTSLALALERAGHPIAAVASASETAGQALAARLAGAVCSNAEAVAAGCELVLLTVPDDALSTLAAALPWARGQRVVHCCGALGLPVLEAARTAGALCGCLHPLQTFPERFGDPARFVGIVCGIEGEGALGTQLETYARDLGATPLRLEGSDRARYHAAAVLASNYVVALHVAAAQAWALAGLPPELARPALAPLTESVAGSVRRLTLESALTGPLARGDLATIESQLRALAGAPELLELYRGLGAMLLALPLALPAERRQALEALLRRRTA